MRRSRRDAGSALLAAVAVALVLAGVAASTLTVVNSVNRETRGARDDLERSYLAESAAGFAEMSLLSGASGNLGSQNAPVSFGAGAYWTVANDNPDNTVTVTCTGVYNGGSRALAATYRLAPGVFDNAIFAGNSSNDPNYVMHFGGVGKQADQVNGDVYSGGDVEFVDDSSISGTARATGTVTGTSGQGGVTQSIPDLQAMQYDTSADVNVVNEFASAAYLSNAAGGTAWQVAESSAAHIFRRDPTDRASDTASTVKDDYFLEDPYEPVHTDSSSDGSDPYVVSLAGSNGNPGADGNEKIYYIDGNLWIHNRKTFSFRIDADDDLAVTFVVRGNIYISDNMFYGDKDKDGLALIAMKDPNVADSGNIYFGDPVFGTLEHMSAYMYAENDFLDNNLSASGSATVTIDGIMSAGNHVAINRDFGTQHSRLTMNFDDRVSNDALLLPGLPTGTAGGVTFLAWQPAAKGN